MLIAGFIVTGLTLYIYKPTYSVTLNNEFIGYTQDKSELQKKINDYLKKGDNNVAFIQVENMPEYHLCMLKKNIKTNDDEIYSKVVEHGTSYYRYYALLNDGEEKYYFSSFENAENVVNKLKEKNSKNIDKITVIEKYDNDDDQVVAKLKSENDTNKTYELKNDKTIAEIDTDSCINSLYEKSKTIKATVKAAQNSTGSFATGMNNTANKTNIGISLAKPVSGMITSRFGRRSRDNHKGLDIATSTGTPIYAAAGGTVTTSTYGYNGGYGNYVIINHGNGLQTVYGHCSSLCVTEGAKVSQGQLIAKVGKTGIATGSHLHFEVRIKGVAQDPQNYVY